jgi:hypothetical protein
MAEIRFITIRKLRIYGELILLLKNVHLRKKEKESTYSSSNILKNKTFEIIENGPCQLE